MDYDDLYEFLSQLRENEFEGYPGITYENGREHLKYRENSEEFYAIELKETGKVIGNIYYGKRDFEAREILEKIFFFKGMNQVSRSGKIRMCMLS